jgi:hypothetical protein
MMTSRPCWSAARNGSGGAGMTLAIVGQLLRRGVGLGEEPLDHLGGGGQDQQAADDGVERVQPVLEAGGQAEVAAAAADRPEQLRMRLVVHLQ